MNKIILVLLPILIITLALFIKPFGDSCDGYITNVKLSHVIDQNSHYFKWYVKNCSEDKLTYEKGSIMNYIIRNTSSNKIYTFKYKFKENIILYNNDFFEKTVVINNLPKGNYSVEFWAASREGTVVRMKLKFEISEIVR